VEEDCWSVDKQAAAASRKELKDRDTGVTRSIVDQHLVQRLCLPSCEPLHKASDGIRSFCCLFEDERLILVSRQF